jgi:hypothetical protein
MGRDGRQAAVLVGQMMNKPNQFANFSSVNDITQRRDAGCHQATFKLGAAGVPLLVKFGIVFGCAG